MIAHRGPVTEDVSWLSGHGSTPEASWPRHRPAQSLKTDTVTSHPVIVLKEIMENTVSLQTLIQNCMMDLNGKSSIGKEGIETHPPQPAVLGTDNSLRSDTLLAGRTLGIASWGFSTV
ncbi:unnamed protein product [Pleuronectes platessa]|uniref:Uncharacterized protein n=1 Tax=Pleuronectes platessa TaxID=8262 RepID=A0A9N7Y5Z5_PLEPL|nr:unnamed protein product [Pleuronectes platessa]